MSVWELVVAYLAIFVLLQFAIYRYFRRDDGDSPAGLGHVPNAEAGPHRDPAFDHEPASDPPARTDALDEDAHADVDGSARRCPSCGARNERDQVFEFCRNCVGPLRR